MSRNKVITKLNIDGKEYVDTLTAMESLRTSYHKDFAHWRNIGMPYMALIGNKQVKYFYHIPDCMRWFAGEDFENAVLTIDKAEAAGVI